MSHLFVLDPPQRMTNLLDANWRVCVTAYGLTTPDWHRPACRERRIVFC
jgi:hypothetical protein